MVIYFVDPMSDGPEKQIGRVYLTGDGEVRGDGQPWVEQMITEPAGFAGDRPVFPHEGKAYMQALLRQYDHGVGFDLLFSRALMPNPWHEPGGSEKGGQFAHSPMPGLPLANPLAREERAARETAEAAAQQALADAQTNPLAHPELVLGGGSSPDSRRYIAAYGEEFSAFADMKSYDAGIARECFRNASMLVTEHPNLSYVEGYAIPPVQSSGKRGDVKDFLDKQVGRFAYLHAWAVDEHGRVVDNTPRWGKGTKYFGVKYDRKRYMQYLISSGIYGVIGSTFENARAATLSGGKYLRGLAKGSSQ